MLKAHEGRGREFRVTNALLGKHSSKVLREAGRMVQESALDPRWEGYLYEVGRNDTSALEALKLFARVSGAVWLRFNGRMRQGDMLLFGLLLEGVKSGSWEDVRSNAARILGMCPKALGRFGVWFRTRYPSAEAMMRDDAQAELYVYAVVTVMNISFIEARHATNQRTAKKGTGGEGHAVPLHTLSAKQAIRWQKKEIEWLDLCVPATEDAGVISSRIKARGPHTWNEWLKDQQFRNVPGKMTAQQVKDRMRQLRSTFTELPDDVLDFYEDRGERKMELRLRKQIPTNAKERASRRWHVIREEFVMCRLQKTAGPLLAKELSDALDVSYEAWKTRKETEDDSREAITAMRRAPDLVNEACELVEEFKDCRDNLVPLCKAVGRRPMLLWFTATPRVAGSKITTDDIWRSLSDPNRFGKNATGWKQRTRLVEGGGPRLRGYYLPYCWRSGGRCLCGENKKYLVFYKRLRTCFFRHCQAKLEKTGTFVIELTGALEEVPPVGSEDRIFFHLSHRIAELHALWRFDFHRLIGGAHPRTRIRSRHNEDNSPEFFDFWDLSFWALDRFLDATLSLTFFNVVTVGEERRPWEIRYLDIERRELVERFGIRVQRFPLWSGFHRESLDMAPRRGSRGQGQAQAQPAAPKPKAPAPPPKAPAPKAPAAPQAPAARAPAREATTHTPEESR